MLAFVQEETRRRELSEHQNCATDAAERAEALHADLAATQEQVAELHSLNAALAGDLSSKGKALEDSEASLEDATSRWAAVRSPKRMCAKHMTLWYHRPFGHE